MAAAFLSDPAVGARWLAARARGDQHGLPTALPSAGQLARSVDAFEFRALSRSHVLRRQGFCALASDRGRSRRWRSAFGWNGGCGAPSDECGKRDLLVRAHVRRAWRRRLVPPLALAVPYGRLSDRTARRKARGADSDCVPRRSSTQRELRQCAAGPDGQRMNKDDWGKCSGGVVVDIVAEGWGQGPRAGERARRRGHDGNARRGGQRPDAGIQSRIWCRPCAVQAPADVSVSALRVARRRGVQSHCARRCGSDHQRPFIQPSRGNSATGVRAGVRCAHCARRWTGSRGKTGTPTFPNDDRSLDDLARLCTPAWPATAARPRRVWPAATVQVVRRRVPHRSRRSRAGTKVDRRADRAQLARRHRARSRRRRSRTQSRGRDRDADRRAPRGRPGAEYRRGSGAK